MGGTQGFHRFFGAQAMKATSLAAAAVLAGLASSPASATVFSLIFTGTVTSDSETNAFGVTGPATNTFVGLDFSDTFVIDTSMGNAVTGVGRYQEYLGGSSKGATSPVSSVAVFGGQTEVFTGDYLGIALGGNGSYCCGGIEHADAQSTSTIDNTASLYGVSGYPNFLSGTGTSGSAAIHITISDASTGAIISSGVLSAKITSVTVISAPESSTWVMMGLGFAGLGFAGWRKARPTAIA